MTTGVRTRYPGVQPFSDDDLSRRLFFGRRSTSIELTNQILANRLVVIFGKSGLGKTSLLHAGVAPRLRDEGHLPLSIRLNDLQRGPLASVVEGVASEAYRQGVEYAAGSPGSLWAYFRTVELWRGDLMLVPVLILDQFEELFTLQTEAHRKSFLTELGCIVRGVAPEGYVDAAGQDRPPQVRIVVSLREDYLGLLEDASDQIPQIMDSRFRIAPLGVDAAEEALVGPARVEDPAFGTAPFAYDPLAVRSVIDFLSHRRVSGDGRAGRYVEPFQLQLICQRVERIVAARPPEKAHEPITLKDIGGVDALEETLKRFYLDILLAIPGRKERRAVQRLCNEHLISPEGRRLSLDEGVILDKLDLTPELLRGLVARRLLRVDTRADASYYELSHDALVDPVLAARGWSAVWIARLQIAGSALGILILGLICFALAIAVAKATRKDLPGDLAAAIMLLIVIYVACVRFVTTLGTAVRSLRRYRARVLTEATGYASSRKNAAVLRVASILVAATFLLIDLFLVLAFVIAFWEGWTGKSHQIASGAAWNHFRQTHRLDALPLDYIVYALASAIAVPSWVLFASRNLKLLVLGAPRGALPAQVSIGSAAVSRLLGALWILASAAIASVALLAMGLFVLLAECWYPLRGHLPMAVPAARFMSIASDCRDAAKDGETVWFFAFGILPHVGVLFLSAFHTCRRGLRLLRPGSASAAVVPSGSVSLPPHATRTRRLLLGASIFGALLLPAIEAALLARAKVAPSSSDATSSASTGTGTEDGPPPQIRGRVVDANGNAVDGASVRILSASRPYQLYQETETAHEGTFTVSDVGPWQVRVVADHGVDGAATSGAVRLTDDKTTELTLALSTSGAVSGQVVDAQGHALAGVALLAEGLPWHIRTTTDATGAFRLTTLPTQATALVAMAPGYKRRRVSLETASNEGPRDVRIALETANPVKGEARDDENNPVIARIVACEDEPWESSTQSGTDGFFELPPEAIGCDARAESARFSPSDAVRVAEGGHLAFQLKPGGGIGGVVVDEHGVPLTTFRIGIESYSPDHGKGFEQPEARDFTQQSGTFHWYGLAPGRYLLGASASALPPARSSAIEVRGGALSTGVRIVVERGGEVAGTVTDEAQVPISGADVRFDQLSAVLTSDAVATTDDAGKYRLKGAPAGIFTVRVHKDGHRAKLVSGLRVGSNDTLTRDITLARVTVGVQTELGGIGAEFTEASGGLELEKVYPNEPAAVAGLRTGDRVLRIDGERTDGMPLSDAIQRVRGEPGTVVILSVERPDTGTTRRATVVRKKIIY